MQNLDFEINKHLWKSEDGYKVYLTFSKIVGQISVSANQKGAINQEELTRLEEAVNVLLALPATIETLRFGEIEDPLYYFFLVVAMVLLMETKNNGFTTDIRYNEFRDKVSKKEIVALREKFINLTESEIRLKESVTYAAYIQENCQKTLEKNKKYPTLADEFIEIIKTSAHAYRLFGNDEWLNNLKNGRELTVPIC